MPHAVPVLCATCRQLSPCDCTAKRQKVAQQARGSSAERGYDRRWQRFRKAYIANVVSLDPFCQDCRGPFGSTSDIELHHKIKVADRPDLLFVGANISAICCRCHSKRTARGE